MYYIWNLEREKWWNQNKFGYTSEIEEAGKFYLEEAEEISKKANILGNVNDKMVEEDDLNQILEVQQLSGSLKKKDVKEILKKYNEGYHKTNPMGDIIEDLKKEEYYPEDFYIEHLAYEENKKYNIKIENERELNISVNLYRMPSGSYEVNAYQSLKNSRKLKP